MATPSKYDSSYGMVKNDTHLHFKYNLLSSSKIIRILCAEFVVFFSFMAASAALFFDSVSDVMYVYSTKMETEYSPISHSPRCHQECLPHSHVMCTPLLNHYPVQIEKWKIKHNSNSFRNFIIFKENESMYQ